MKKRQHGFTIVELLIVIVVIAILAAITIVAFNGIQNRANDGTVQSDLNSFAKLMEFQKADLGKYPATLTASMGFKFSKNAYGKDVQNRNVRYCYNSSTDSYALVSNSKSGNHYKLVNGVISTTSSTASHGAYVCTFVGIPLSTTPVVNPSQDGYYESRNPQWDSWVN